MKIKVNKLENFVKMPDRAHYNDSGADVFCTEDVCIQPHSSYAIPLGISVELPDGYDRQCRHRRHALRGRPSGAGRHPVRRNVPVPRRDRHERGKLLRRGLHSAVSDDDIAGL